MSRHLNARIRPFDPTHPDAEGILRVDRATFHDCPYDAEQVCRLLTHGPLRAWVADVGGSVAGFVVALPTRAARGPGWEIDLLAVHPDHQGRGIGTALVSAARANNPNPSARQRAVVATANAASARAFRRAGFQPAPVSCRLLRYAVHGRHPRPPVVMGIGASTTVRTEAPAELDSLLLVVETEDTPWGQAELLPVQTLLYRGAWLESIAARSPAARTALVHAVVERAKAAAWDEVGSLVPGRAPGPEEADWVLRHALLAAGFRDVGEYRVFTYPPEVDR
jgi:ribosomal protein S18 acetylase RimI-like enzyme